MTWLLVLLPLVLLLLLWRNHVRFRKWERACQEAHQAGFADLVEVVHRVGWDHEETRNQLDVAIAKYETLCKIRDLTAHKEHLAYLQNLKANLAQAQTS